MKWQNETDMTEKKAKQGQKTNLQYDQMVQGSMKDTAM